MQRPIRVGLFLRRRTGKLRNWSDCEARVQELVDTYHISLKWVSLIRRLISAQPPRNYLYHRHGLFLARTSSDIHHHDSFGTGGGLAYRGLQGLASCPSTFPQYFCSAPWGSGYQQTQVNMAQTKEVLSHQGPPFDVLTATAADLQKLLVDGEIKSTELVEIYLKQIDRHNKRGLKLNAMISTTSKDILLSIAKSLDDERSSGNIRGPLHGIPITLKVGNSLIRL